ncbi:Uncharacterised protein [Chryseobacterium nakagawai]|uniref:Uncharacterized protein n=1 Tax=Chryseobacterium nakagawai TaxID=1241982 RepID=A0AAD0YPQ6_CHRNA|nr:hypothetical protein [Chryseobacterium nakagawai]AZA93060.1 hypothetical protein EG343_21870 [Chryseobacterium nakagawai]VEH19693.1 Uncharacterised protein [Chryseobacterium nakagawai]
MNKLNLKLGIALGIFTTILLGLIMFGKDIEFLNKDKVVTSAGIGDGIFFSMADFLTYNVFVICCVISVISICINIKGFSKS